MSIYSQRFILLYVMTFCLYVHAGVHTDREQQIPSGHYIPFFSAKTAANKVLPGVSNSKQTPVEVKAFYLDIHPVTNGEYLDFIKKHPEWQRSKVPKIFADHSYLKHWKSDLKLRSSEDKNRPITNVSWFSASAYCQSLNKELPTTDQWEYASEDGGRNATKVKDTILSWYAVPNSNTLNRVKVSPPNGYGIYDLHGLIWEWTQDFNNQMSIGELRNDGTKDDNLFCGSGSLNALDATDYAKFMRYSFRNSLKADYTTSNLGFRCAQENKNEN